MQVIATDVLDTKEKMVNMAQEQLKKPGFAIDPYFYRSHVTYQSELEQSSRAGFTLDTLVKFQIKEIIFCLISVRIP